MTNDQRYCRALEVTTSVLEDEQEASGCWMAERSEALGGARPIDLVQTMDQGHPVQVDISADAIGFLR